MKKWTKQAEERFGEYLDARVRRDGLVGEDARELREDLSSHLHEEAAGLDVQVVGVAELEQMLSGLDGGKADLPDPTAKERRRGWLLTFGVILPVLVTVLEIFTGFCGGVFFDPVPTAWHGLILLSVPALNLWLMTKGRSAGSLEQGLAVGIVVVVSGFYALLFFPLLPLSILALAAFGMGLLSLAPILAFVSAYRISARNRRHAAQPWRYRRGWKTGGLAAMAVLILLEGPGVWTRIQLFRANSDEKHVAKSGLAMLRMFHSERTLLKACYEGSRGTAMATDISGWMGSGWRIPASMIGINQRVAADSESSRSMFFRTTGKPFNSLKPPRMLRWRR